VANYPHWGNFEPPTICANAARACCPAARMKGAPPLSSRRGVRALRGQPASVQVRDLPSAIRSAGAMSRR
jgi:hypothetical protein